MAFNFSCSSWSSWSSCGPQQVTFSQGPSLYFVDDDDDDDCNGQVTFLQGPSLYFVDDDDDDDCNGQVGYSDEWKGLDPCSEEFDSVTNLLFGTWKPNQVGKGNDAKGLDHDQMNVVNIYDVNNPYLLDRYEQRKSEISYELSPYAAQSVRDKTGKEVATTRAADDSLLAQCDENLNECFLFHGTSFESAQSIMSEGFRPGNGGLFHKAIYFAESSTKADQYADSADYRVPNGTHLYMLIAKVVLGTVKICQDPPCKYSCTGSSCYHSIIGTHNGDGDKLRFREFVIKDEAQCFPQYLVEYYRS